MILRCIIRSEKIKYRFLVFIDGRRELIDVDEEKLFASEIELIHHQINYWQKLLIQKNNDTK